MTEQRNEPREFWISRAWSMSNPNNDGCLDKIADNPDFDHGERSVIHVREVLDAAPPELAGDVEKQIENASKKYACGRMNQRNAEAAFNSGATEFYKRGLATGWSQAIEAIRDMNPFITNHLKEEAKRRNILPTKDEKKDRVNFLWCSKGHLTSVKDMKLHCQQCGEQLI